MTKSSVYFSAPHFWLVPPQFGCSGDGSGQRAGILAYIGIGLCRSVLVDFAYSGIGLSRYWLMSVLSYGYYATVNSHFLL